MHGQSNLWRDIDEPFTQDEPHRLCAVVQEFAQVFHHRLLTALLTATQEQLFDLLSTLSALQSKGAFSLPATTTIYKKTLNVSFRPGGNFPQQPLKHCTIALKSFSSPKGCEVMGTRNCNTTAKLQTAEDQREEIQETDSSLTLELLGPVLTLCSILSKPQQVTAFKESKATSNFITPVLHSGIPNPSPAVQACYTGCTLIYY